uniref:Uncharacterized protein n=2 Tax=Timema TaxID=61471 RepID=A0A7R9AVW0_TIMSH|nr:unnamed protein product [Timema shepardi]
MVKVSSSWGIGIFLSAANFLSASYLILSASTSSLILLLLSCMASMSRYSWDFSVSSSSFCSMRLMRQLEQGLFVG